MPSQAITIKSSSGLIVHLLISGTHVIGCLSTERPGVVLCLRSPNDRDKFKFPSTLPSTISDPALYILSFSIGFSGLWSSDRSSALPPLANTHLESPAFAQYISLPLMRTTLAVQPLESNMKLSSDLSVGPFVSSPPESSFISGLLDSGFARATSFICRFPSAAPKNSSVLMKLS